MEGLTLEIKSKLKTALTRLYNDKANVREVLKYSGEDTGDYNFDGSVSIVWFNAIEELIRRNSLEKVVDQALEDYPEDISLREVKYAVTKDLSVPRLNDEISKIISILPDVGLSDSYEYILELLDKTGFFLKGSLKEIKTEYDQILESFDVPKIKQAKIDTQDRVVNFLNLISNSINTVANENIIISPGEMKSHEDKKLDTETIGSRELILDLNIDDDVELFGDHSPEPRGNDVAMRGDYDSHSKSDTDEPVFRDISRPKTESADRGKSESKEKKFSSATFDLTKLSKSLEAAKSVCLLKCANGSMATGIVLKGGFLMCPNYVLPTPEVAKNCEIVFGYYDHVTSETESFKLDSGLMYSSPVIQDNFGLFYSIIKIADKSDQLDKWGYLNLEKFSEPVVGDSINIIHHPLGKKQSIGVPSIIEKIDKDMLIYNLETHPGSGGGALLNQEFNLIGMHVMKYNNKSGSIPLKAGINIKAVIDDLKSKKLGHLPFIKD